MSLLLQLTIKNHFQTTKYSSSLLVFILNNYLQKSTNVDAIDSFTTELVGKKALKWEILRQKLKQEENPTEVVDEQLQLQHVKTPVRPANPLTSSARMLFQNISALRDVDLGIDFNNLKEFHIDHLVVASMSEEKIKNFYELLDQCVKYQKIPSEAVVLQILEYLSEKGDKNYLTKFIDLCKTTNEARYGRQDQFNNFLARCLWRQGNWDQALTLLTASYTNVNNAKEKKSFREIFRKIVEETVGQKSEAVLVALTKIAIDLNDKHNESFVLVNVWKSCFLSTWFSDQQLAINLFDNHRNIRQIVGKRTSIFCYNLLREYNVDSVHRLIELFLKFDMKNECKICLEMLFQYQYWRRDLRACSEIMQNSIAIDVQLSDANNAKLLNLLLGNYNNSNDSENSNKNIKIKKIVSNKFELKF